MTLKNSIFGFCLFIYGLDDRIRIDFQIKTIYNKTARNTNSILKNRSDKTMLEIAANELKYATADFYNITGIEIVLYDENRTWIYSYPEKIGSFCEQVRTNASLAEKCIECDNKGFDICDKTKKPYIYQCHMNLLEAIAPIIENDIIIGYMMLGQVLSKNDIEAVKEKVLLVCDQYRLDSEKMLSELKKIKTIDSRFINSAVSMMSMCACYLYCNRIIENKREMLSYQIKSYIEMHLSEDLTIQKLCDTFFVSKTKLYHISKKNFGMGITDYIRYLRLEKAKLLLQKKENSISNIALAVGFQDANYFTRIFKKYENMTPKNYKTNAI